jgi:hypothetical protein
MKRIKPPAPLPTQLSARTPALIPRTMIIGRDGEAHHIALGCCKSRTRMLEHCHPRWNDSACSDSSATQYSLMPSRSQNSRTARWSTVNGADSAGRDPAGVQSATAFPCSCSRGKCRCLHREPYRTHSARSLPMSPYWRRIQSRGTVEYLGFNTAGITPAACKVGERKEIALG